ncbi:ankyrin repeat domain-containing protein [Rickettsiella endosymbiont of Miltochrista miniata]|uniref:ankyrin repeat domain-containing protein n=1 Tax=Rickettsiella endosymbiont of Miltochrista miniata TaxID=3066239 RepID=UPI00313D160E
MPTPTLSPTQQLLEKLHEAFAYEKGLWDHQASSEPIVAELFRELNDTFADIFNLLNQEIELDTVDIENKTVLYYAVLFQEPKILKQLLAKDAKPNMLVDADQTALDIAVINNRPKNVILLLKDIRTFNEITDKHGLLNLAARYSSSEIITILLKKGATLHFKDNNDNTPLHRALQAGDVSCLVDKKRFEVMRQLLDANVPCTTRNKEGETALDLILKKLNLVSTEIIQEKDRIKIIEVCKLLIEPSLLENPLLSKPSLLENLQLAKFWDDCQKIASTLNDKIPETNYSLADFIKERNTEKLAAMCRNENIVSAVELKINDCAEFLYYEKRLKSGLENGLIRNLAVEGALKGMSEKTSISKNIFVNLIPYLPTKDIQVCHIATNPSVFFKVYYKSNSSSAANEITHLPKPN